MMQGFPHPKDCNDNSSTTCTNLIGGLICIWVLDHLSPSHHLQTFITFSNLAILMYPTVRTESRFFYERGRKHKQKYIKIYN